MAKNPGTRAPKKGGAKGGSKKGGAKATAKAGAATEKVTDQKEGPVQGTNILSEDQKRAIFLNHVTILDAAKKAVAKAQKRLSETKSLIKQEGGDVKLTEKGIELMAQEDKSAERVRAAEIKTRRNIEDTLRVAKWVGSDLGQVQLDWLGGVVPATDRAFDEGKIAGLKGEARKPSYDPSVPQYKRWMEGFDEGQAVLKTKFKASTSDKKAPATGAERLIFEDDAPPAKPANPKATGAKAQEGGGKPEPDPKAKPAAGAQAGNKGQGAAQTEPAATKPQTTAQKPAQDAAKPGATAPTPPAPPPDEQEGLDLQQGGSPPTQPDQRPAGSKLN